MAGAQDVVERSMSINAKFLPRLKAAVEQNALLRIGWTGSGEEVPKNGEVGLCPGIPEGARIKALGKLGSWTSPFGAGASISQTLGDPDSLCRNCHFLDDDVRTRVPISSTVLVCMGVPECTMRSGGTR